MISRILKRLNLTLKKSLHASERDEFKYHEVLTLKDQKMALYKLSRIRGLISLLWCQSLFS